MLRPVIHQPVDDPVLLQVFGEIRHNIIVPLLHGGEERGKCRNGDNIAYGDGCQHGEEEDHASKLQKYAPHLEADICEYEVDCKEKCRA